MALKQCGLLAFLMIPLIAEAAEIKEASSFDEVLDCIQPGTWLVTDYDHVVVQSTTALGHIGWYYAETAKYQAQGLSLEAAIDAIYPDCLAIQEACSVQPVDETFIPGLRDLQRAGYTVMALTHRRPLLADATLNQLKGLNFTFLTQSPGPNNVDMTTDLGAAIYRDGVLLAGEYHDKGKLFLEFLERIGQRPLRVVFLDDNAGFVKEFVETVAPHIDCVGIHFKAIEKAEKIFDPALADFQYSQFKETKEIVSNAYAAAALQN